MTHSERSRIRARILDGARECFLEEGLEGLSIRAIASKAGVSSMTLYLYYESREDIIRHIAIDGFKQLNAAVDKAVAGSKDDALKALSTAYLAWALANPRLYASMYTHLSNDVAAAPEDPLLAGPSNAVADHVKTALLAAGHGDASASKHSTFLWGLLHSVAILEIGGQAEQRGVALETLEERFLQVARGALANVETSVPKVGGTPKKK